MPSLPHVISGHQPGYLPWLGLFHKMSLADQFIVMDDAQYLHKDWQNRNRILTTQGPLWLTVPVLHKEATGLPIREVRIDTSLKGTNKDWQLKHYQSIKQNYSRAPFWSTYAPFLEELYLKQTWEWLIDPCLTFLYQIMKETKIEPELIMSSQCNFTRKKSDLILEHCERFSADIIALGAMGEDYLTTDDFINRGIFVHFQHYQHPVYPQKGPEFVSHLSILDLLMNCGPESGNILKSGNVSKEGLCLAAQKNSSACVLQ